MDVSTFVLQDFLTEDGPRSLLKPSTTNWEVLYTLKNTSKRKFTR